MLVPYAGLARVCRQIRREFMEMQRSEACLRVGWFQLGRYLSTFHNTVKLGRNLPKKLEILLAPVRITPLYEATDLLPLIMISANCPNMSCDFIPHPFMDEVEDYELGRSFCQIDVECYELNTLIRLFSEDVWVEHFGARKLSSIKAHRAGPFRGEIHFHCDEDDTAMTHSMPKGAQILIELSANLRFVLMHGLTPEHYNEDYRSGVDPASV